MYLRRSIAEVLCYALFICLAYASFQSVNGQNRNAPSTNTNTAAAAGDKNANAGDKKADTSDNKNASTGDKKADAGDTKGENKKADTGDKNADTGDKKIDWMGLSASEFEARARTFPKTAQLKSITMPGGASMTVEVQAPIKANSVFYARLADGGATDLPVEAVWNPEQPDVKDSSTKVRLQIPDLGVTFSSHSRRLVLVSLSQEGGTGQQTPNVAVVQQVSITNWKSCAVYAVLSGVLAYGLAVFAVGWRRGKYSLSPVYLTADKYGKASLSRFQIFAFTLLVFGLLVFIFLRTGVLTDISPDILLLLGISAAGATGAAVTDSMKTRLSFENWSWLRNIGWLTTYERGTCQADDPNRARWGDLLKTDKDFDIYKFQLVTVSFVVGAGLLGSDLMSLSKFTVPPNLLGLLGLSNAVFIAGKAVGTSFAELNDKMDKLRAAERDWMSKLSGVVGPVTGQDKKLEEAIKATPDKYQTYISLAREAARMLQALYGTEGTKFKDSDIDDAKLVPIFP